MGAWGDGPFENDDAGDWVYELEEAPDTTLLAETLAKAMSDEPCDATVASRAVAAAEVVAALLGKPGEDLPEEVVGWLAGKHAPAELAEAAKGAVASCARTPSCATCGLRRPRTLRMVRTKMTRGRRGCSSWSRDFRADAPFGSSDQISAAAAHPS